MFISVIFFGSDNAASPFFCVSPLSKVFTGALHFEMLTNISCAICTMRLHTMYDKRDWFQHLSN